MGQKSKSTAVLLWASVWILSSVWPLNVNQPQRNRSKSFNLKSSEIHLNVFFVNVRRFSPFPLWNFNDVTCRCTGQMSDWELTFDPWSETAHWWLFCLKTTISTQQTLSVPLMTKNKQANKKNTYDYIEVNVKTAEEHFCQEKKKIDEMFRIW